MSFIRPIGLAVCAGLLAAHAAAVQAAAADIGWSDSLVGTAIAQGTFPGAVVVVVRKDQPAFLKSYGVSSVVRRDPIDPDRTMLQIGSITKLFTAIVALQLADEGRLDLDGDVAQTLKRFKLSRPELGRMTIHDLLTHQAGFDSSLIGTTFDDPGKVQESPEQLRRMFIRVRAPEEITSYDNLAVGLLGLALEDITGQSYSELVRTRIFLPLGMQHSITQFDPRYGPQLAGCAVPDGHGGWEACRWQYSPVRDVPAGGIYATGADLAKFLSALLSEGRYPGGRLVSAAAWARFTDFDNNRLNPGLPGIGLLALQQAPVERGDWGHDGGGYGSVNTLYVSPRGGVAGFLGVTGGSKDTPLTLSGIVEYFRIDAAREEQFGAAYQLLRKFDHEIAALAPIAAADQRSATYTQAPFTPAEIRRLQGRYFPARRWNYAPLLGRFLPALLPWTEVEVNADGSLSIDGQGPWRQVAPRLFQGPEGRRLGFEIRGGVISGGSVTHSRLERHPWWAQPQFTVVPFFAALAWALSGIIPALRARLGRSARQVGWLSALGGAALLVSLACEFEYGPDLYVAHHESVALAFRIPMQLALALLALLPFVFAASIRANAWRGWLSRLHGAMLTVAAIVVVILSGYFGLIGRVHGV
ncbi:MAG: serine hydrolase domain-containing protein [Steroidobacteraceae bacterium]